MQKTPKSLRLQIAIFGRTNVGKSSFLNTLCNQNVSITSSIAGTTTDVVEKPIEITNNYCGMGYYFFKNNIFDYISLTSPSKLRNEIEITDVIQIMIDKGEKIKPVLFKGHYLNITYPENLRKWKNWL